MKSALDKVGYTRLLTSFLQRFSLSGNSTLLCCYSGGPDSTFLLDFLCNARKEAGFKLVAFYLNHNLRGKESVEEEKFVFSTISRLSVPTLFYSKDISAIAKERKISTELCGREVRRGIVKSLIETLELDYVCTGHHRDDRVETYLFNTFRGSGLHGLTTLKEQEGKVIRPLLSLSKREIEDFLQEEGISFHVDSTNRESDYSRNKLRNIIIPAVKETINPSVEETIARNIAVLEEYEEMGARLVAIFVDKYVRWIGNYVYISRGMQQDPLFVPLLLKEVVRKVIRNMGAVERNVAFVNYEQLVEFFLRKKEETIALDLPGAVKVFFDQRGMVLVFNGEGERLQDFSQTIADVQSCIDEACFSISLKPFQGEARQVFPLSFPVLVRGRRPGDRISLVGHVSQKKAKEVLIDEKIPSYEKAFHPVIELPEGVTFLAGVGMEGGAFEIGGKNYSFHYQRKEKVPFNQE